MDLIDNVSNVVLIMIRAGVIFRVVFCFFKMITAEEESAQYKKRLKNVLFFYILAEMAFIIKALVLQYYV